MRMMINGFSGWARMRNDQNENVRVVDTAITVVGTLLAALAFAILRH
jgi:hypothetical protein